MADEHLPASQTLFALFRSFTFHFIFLFIDSIRVIITPFLQFFIACEKKVKAPRDGAYERG